MIPVLLIFHANAKITINRKTSKTLTNKPQWVLPEENWYGMEIILRKDSYTVGGAQSLSVGYKITQAFPINDEILALFNIRNFT